MIASMLGRRKTALLAATTTAAAALQSSLPHLQATRWSRCDCNFFDHATISSSTTSIQLQNIRTKCWFSTVITKRRQRRRDGSTSSNHCCSNLCLLASSSPQSGGDEEENSNGNPKFYAKEYDNSDDDDDDEIDDETFLRRELAHLESLEEILNELEGPSSLWDEDLIMWDESSLDELLGDIKDDDDDDDTTSSKTTDIRNTFNLQERQKSAAQGLEQALRQGMVPVSAGVGSDGLPGDFGFDPLQLSTRDLIRPAQQFWIHLLPRSRWEEYDDSSNNLPKDLEEGPRPNALILRDYREAEIRHGRLAMLAAIFWPLQEMLDRFVLSEDQFGPLIYSPITLPYFPLIMTAIMLLLGYLDIYSQSIKDMDRIGEAFVPGDCFWDPLAILQGASDRTKRNMQERELFNGRAAMLAVAAYTLEEAFTHKPFIALENNAILLEPPFTVPFIQRWLDAQFSVTDPTPAFLTPSDLESLQTMFQETLLVASSTPESLLP